MMKILRSAYLTLLVVLLFLVGSAAARPQSPPQSGDQDKSDSTATKNSKKPKKTDSPAQSVTPATTPAETPANTPGSTGPASKPANTQPAPPASVAVTVWVNTDTGIYHKPGSRFYGKTKKGKYMTETDARKAGYREAKKE
jgi:cytoskeletal protein RodZ